jgi:hypothetical protein
LDFWLGVSGSIVTHVKFRYNEHMKIIIVYLGFLILISSGARAANSEQDHDEINKSEIFVCGEKGGSDRAYHLAITDDDRLVSFTKSNLESMAEEQLTYLPAKITMEKLGDTCSITVVERKNRGPEVGQFEFDTDNGKVTNFRYTTNEKPEFSGKSRQCRLLKEYEKAFGKCSFSKDSFTVGNPSTEEHYYNCGFKGEGKPLNAAERNLRVKDPKDGTDACFYLLFCKLKPDPKLLASAKSAHFIPYYDSWMACLPLNTKCKKNYADCSHEGGLEMLSSDDSKIREAVGMSVHSAK